MTTTTDRPDSRSETVLLTEIEERLYSLFGDNTSYGFTFHPGNDEYDIAVWFEVQYRKDPEFQPTKSELEWRLVDMLKGLRDHYRVGRVIFREANGATREDAIRSLWRMIFEYEPG